MRVLLVGYVGGMGLLAAWLMLAGHARGYLGGVALVAVAAVLPLVRTGRHVVYGLGVVACMATLLLGLWPPDGGAGYCGSAFYRHDANPSVLAEDGFDPESFLAACDERRHRNTVLVGLGGVTTLAPIGYSIGPANSSSSRRRHHGSHLDSRA